MDINCELLGGGNGRQEGAASITRGRWWLPPLFPPSIALAPAHSCPTVVSIRRQCHYGWTSMRNYY